VDNFDIVSGVHSPSGIHLDVDWSDDIAELVSFYVDHRLFTEIVGRSHKCITIGSADVLSSLGQDHLSNWIFTCMTKFKKKHYYQY